MNVRLSPDLLPLGESFSAEAFGVGLPNPDVGLDPIEITGEEGPLWFHIVDQYNDLAQENSDFIVASLSLGCETSVDSLMARYADGIRKASHDDADKQVKEPEPEAADFLGEEILTIQKGGRFKFPDEWQGMIENSYMIFDETSGAIFVMNEEGIPDDVITVGVDRLKRAYAEKGKHIPRIANSPSPYYRSLPVGRAGVTHIDPSVFDRTNIDGDAVFNAPLDVRFKGHGSYFTIERADGGWQVPADRINKLRNLMVGIACKAIEATAPLSAPEQNQTALEFDVA